MSRFYCGTKKRRWLVRNDPKLNGIDYLEVQDRELPENDEFRQRKLDVFFLKDIKDIDPGSLGVENVIIEGGERIRGISVMIVDKPDGRLLTITLNKRGDFSPYTLKLIKQGDVDSPPDDYDPVLSSVQFSFKVEAPNDFDVMPEDRTVSGTTAIPPIDYLAKDYASFRRQMLDRLAVTIPDWQETSPADLGMAIVEVLAYAADQLSYYQDAVATEAYLGTARTRPSLRRHARLLDYQMHEGCNARTWIHVKVEKSRADGYVIPAHQALHTAIAPDMLVKLSSPAEKQADRGQGRSRKASAPGASGDVPPGHQASGAPASPYTPANPPATADGPANGGQGNRGKSTRTGGGDNPAQKNPHN
ncbi:MAG: hypothetical protein IIA59_09370 [Candidatus Marinimicrobia bacterium]|nr:hypothetical protein [Candidatus Neomarinimicrobiota bacterium]